MDDKTVDLVKRMLGVTLNLTMREVCPTSESLRTFDIDFGLRQMLQGSSAFFSYDYTEPLDQIPFSAPVCLHSLLGYIVILYRLPGPEGKLLVFGPFLPEPPSDTFLGRVLSQSRIPARMHPILETYYVKLPVLSEEKVLSVLQEVLSLWKERFEPDAVTRIRFWNEADAPPQPEPTAVHTFSLEQMEQVYELRNDLLRRVAKGDTKSALSALEQYLERGRTHTVTSSVQLQGWLAAFNVQCELALAGGGVHPFYREALMRQLSMEIQTAQSVRHLNTLAVRIVERYCALVGRSGASRYSVMVHEAVNYIDLSVGEDITLRSLAEMLGRSEAYLATQFKKETQLTVTQYVHAKKVEEAAWLLSVSDLTIQQAALRVGITNQGYFSRLFKAHFGVPPQQYRKVQRGTGSAGK